MSENRKVLETRDSSCGCDGCYFDPIPYNCPIALQAELFPCEPDNREDGRNVIWVLVEEASNGNV